MDRHQLRPHYIEDPPAFTWTDKTLTSYIDFFIASSNSTIEDLQIESAVGHSDHQLLSCSIQNVLPIKSTRYSHLDQKLAKDLEVEFVNRITKAHSTQQLKGELYFLQSRITQKRKLKS